MRQVAIAVMVFLTLSVDAGKAQTAYLGDAECSIGMRLDRAKYIANVWGYDMVASYEVENDIVYDISKRGRLLGRLHVIGGIVRTIEKIWCDTTSYLAASKILIMAIEDSEGRGSGKLSYKSGKVTLLPPDVNTVYWQLAGRGILLMIHYSEIRGVERHEVRQMIGYRK